MSVLLVTKKKSQLLSGLFCYPHSKLKDMLNFTYRLVKMTNFSLSKFTKFSYYSGSC